MPTVNIPVGRVFEDFDSFVWPVVARLWKFQLDLL